MPIKNLIETAQTGQAQGVISDAEKFSGRVPEDIISFWKSHGTHFFAESRVTWTTPDVFDLHLNKLLNNVPTLDASDFAAVSYNCFGMTDLWYRNSEHWVYDRQTGLLDNQSARRAFDLQPSHAELQELFAESGLVVPTENSAEFQTLLEWKPEDLTQVLSFGALSDAVHEIVDSEYEPILPALEGKFGTATRDVIFLCNSSEGGLAADEFQSLSVVSALKSLPRQVMISVQTDQVTVKNEVFATSE